MKYTSHKGKEVTVSDKRFEEYKKNPWNNEQWLEFRIKHFGFSREELIMNPSPNMLFLAGTWEDENGRTHLPQDENGRMFADHRQVFYVDHGEHPYAGGYYCVQESVRYFATPDEAYEYALSLPLRANENVGC